MKPARASCSVHLVPRGKNSLRFSKMFQVVLQYFEDRFASFYVDEPLSNFQDHCYRSREKCCTVSSRCLRPANKIEGLRDSARRGANHNIIQRSFIANIYQYWQERQFYTSPKFSGTLRLVVVPSNQVFQLGNASRVEGICSQYWIPFEAITEPNVFCDLRLF